jgi:hypothetical protein
MKIGLLAYHSVCNFGAILQLFSTYSYLRNHGHDPIIINWVTEGLDQQYKNSSKSDQISMSIALRKQLWVETELCRDSADVAQAIQSNGIEAVIVGSDAVLQHHPLWERIQFPTRTIFTIYHPTEDRMYPNPFWGEFNKYLAKPVPWCVISGSSQNSQYKAINKKDRNAMSDSLKGVSYISTRDRWTSDMISFVTNGRLVPDVTPDPVFAFNHNAQANIPSKEETFRKFGLKRNYVLMSFKYWSVSQQWIDEFVAIANANTVDIIKLPFSDMESIGKMNHEIPFPLSPIDWYALIKYSSGYVGHNMHPIVVALHNAVPFFSFDNYGIKKCRGLFTNEKSSKIYHILNLAGFESNRVSCISSRFNPPTPSTVFSKLQEFPTEKAKSFSKEYYSKYQAMMDSALSNLQK